MIHKELKKLREGNNFTLKVLASRVGYGTGNLSSYENGKLKAKDETLLRILMRGYKMNKKEAKERIALWRKKELEETYRLQLAQATEPYNKKKKTFTLDDYLQLEGLDDETIQKIKADIRFYKKRVK